MKTKNRLLWLVSLAVALVDLVLVMGTLHLSDRAMDQHYEKEVERVEASFAMLLDRTALSMLTMSTFVANDMTNKGLLYRAWTALQREGGGQGGQETARVREALLQRVQPEWERVQQDFGIRQLHFHLGPSDISFLRVHMPEKFGDDLSQIRHGIVRSLQEGFAVSGFETGRSESGIRGISPLIVSDALTGRTIQVGSVEVGTSFDGLISILDQRTGMGVGVLLNRDHAKATMWPDRFEKRFAHQDLPCDCVMEAKSRSGFENIIRASHHQGLEFTETQTALVTLKTGPVRIMSFPLFDIAGQLNRDAAPIGRIVMWEDASDELALRRDTVYGAILYAIGGFVIVEAMILLAFGYGTKRLQQEVKAKTHEISQYAEEMSRISHTDRLTGLNNRLVLDEVMEREIERANRHGGALSCLMIDMDHFKTVNDTYGHQAGDDVLKALADILRIRARASDTLGRWGGEEFLILCPITDAQGAMDLAEQIRMTIDRFHFPHIDHRSCSIGVAELQTKESGRGLIARADAALYLAKEEGRNCVRLG